MIPLWYWPVAATPESQEWVRLQVQHARIYGRIYGWHRPVAN